MTEIQTNAIINPDRNALNAGLSIEKIQAAIAKSGYPLQTHVANTLRSLGFSVSPEWSFIDRDTNEYRSMDMRAQYSFPNVPLKTRARPALDLLIECKQSEMPFVFFTGEAMPWNAILPFIVGQKSDTFRVHTGNFGNTWSLDLHKALSLRRHEFYTTPPVAYTFSKCQRKGSDIILSGEEAYNGLIMPLVKSLHYLKVAERPPTTASYFDIHYANALAILDAPMIAFDNDDAQMVPWVRILRHEAGSAELGKNDRGKNIVIDVIHRDFVEIYTTNHLLPAAHDFARKVLDHDTEVAECVGYVEDMDIRIIENIEPYLKKK